MCQNFYVFLQKSLPQSPDEAASEPKDMQIVVDRPEDYENRKRGPDKGAGGGQKQDRKKRIVEVALRIGGDDLDFSTSDDEELEESPVTNISDDDL
jgi:hypothetical protein